MTKRSSRRGGALTEIERREGYLTSYAALTAELPSGRQVSGVRIPLIQRDYAQGRPGRRVEEIRQSFLDVLHGALSGGAPVGLDFVYGDVAEDGRLLPLDGQQRLTTLFLLHWYLCVRVGENPAEYGWSRFSYDTRASARRFCERMVANPPPPDELGLAAWVVDQPWFLHGWPADPTISSMLTMLEAIEQRFEGTDLAAAWTRLLDTNQPAVTFLLLPIDEIGAGDELYIKMNSRGKPLTPFENFKARLEQTLAWAPDRADELAHKIDGPWADLLWTLRGEDDSIDERFMRLLRFAIEVCEWREGRTETGDLLHQRAAVTFSADNATVHQHLSWLFDIFDVWSGYEDVSRTFQGLFSTSHRPAADGAPPQVVLFGSDARPDLFAECCNNYGKTRGKARVFPLTQTLLLYAVVLHRIHQSADTPYRLRILRNLLAASGDEVRRENMPKLVADVDSLVLADSPTQALSTLTAFRGSLVDAEREKLAFLGAHPDLAPVVHRLEDHPLLRGSLGAFDLDPVRLPRRADAFIELFGDSAHWPLLTGALLAAGDYQRRRPNSEAWQFGTGSPTYDWVWRTLFSGSRDDLVGTRTALTTLLDAFAADEAPPIEFLDRFTQTWLEDQQFANRLDWRYYLVRYPCMREGNSGIYYGADGVLGYSLCMLRRIQLNSYYRDPFLLAIWRESGVGEVVRDPWFTGYPTKPRWMELSRSGTAIRSVDRGIALAPPDLEDHRVRFEAFCSEREDVVAADDNYLVSIEQRELPDGGSIDIEDRVTKGASILKALAAEGL